MPMHTSSRKDVRIHMCSKNLLNDNILANIGVESHFLETHMKPSISTNNMPSFKSRDSPCASNSGLWVEFDQELTTVNLN